MSVVFVSLSAVSRAGYGTDSMICLLDQMNRKGLYIQWLQTSDRTYIWPCGGYPAYMTADNGMVRLLKPFLRIQGVSLELSLWQYYMGNVVVLKWCRHSFISHQQVSWASSSQDQNRWLTWKVWTRCSPENTAHTAHILKREKSLWSVCICTQRGAWGI